MMTATESRIGARFPESYRLRMMRSNGGQIHVAGDEWELIPIRDDTDRKRLTRTTSDVISETASYSGFPTWPQLALAIAHNGSGDALVMFQSGSGFEPEIFVWSHEDGALMLVAESFGELRDA
jgi:hypothetical protein